MKKDVVQRWTTCCYVDTYLDRGDGLIECLLCNNNTQLTEIEPTTEQLIAVGRLKESNYVPPKRSFLTKAWELLRGKSV